jgi:hypothetical protein
MLPVLRHYQASFSGESWIPCAPTLASGVYASRWNGNGLSVWTIVNRNESAVSGPVVSEPYQAGMRYFDIIH